MVADIEQEVKVASLIESTEEPRDKVGLNRVDGTQPGTQCSSSTDGSIQVYQKQYEKDTATLRQTGRPAMRSSYLASVVERKD
jgi:hypothetical protein